MYRNAIGARLWHFAAIIGLVVLLAGCEAHSIQQATIAPEPSVQQSYRLGAGDRLRLIVFGQDDLSNIYSVDGDGRISMPLIGLVQVAGMTTSGVEQEVAARLRNGYIRNPNVSVEVQTFRPFYILGEVRQPGQYAYRSGLTIKSAVAIAGGYSERAARRRMLVTRTVDGQSVRLKAPNDAVIRPGDTIEVFERLF